MKNYDVISANEDVPTKFYVDGHPWKFKQAVELLPAGTNLNTVVDTGFYTVDSPTNAPLTGWWYLEVLSHSGDPSSWRIQRITFLSYYSSPSENPRVYIRRLSAGTWGAWGELPMVESKGNYRVPAWDEEGSGLLAYANFLYNGFVLNVPMVRLEANPTSALDTASKQYVDNVVHVGTSQPTGSEIWIDTAAPDPTEMLLEQIVSLTARIAVLEERLNA